MEKNKILSSQSLQTSQTLQGLQTLQNVQTLQTVHNEQDFQPPKLTPLDQWYDNFDVMKKLHISQRTLQTLRSNGKLPFAKMGGKCYYKESDLQLLLEESYRDSRVKPMPSPDKGGQKGGKPCP